MQHRCIVIPAIKKNAVIPDQLVKKMAGKTLIQRAIDIAKDVASLEDIYVVTDSDEIRLICERNDVNAIYDAEYRIASLDIVAALKDVLQSLTAQYEHIIIYRASSPLITGIDIEDAYRLFVAERSDCLVTVKSVKYRLWREKGQTLDEVLFDEEGQDAYIETKALFMLRADALGKKSSSLVITPYFLNERSLEITAYQDWWLCEKILQRKHVVFVVAGYPAIGMGHVFRGLMLAHEIADHKITFLCTRQSELAASSIIARDYKAKMQTNDDLAHDVLRLNPDLVINDFLDTDKDYILRLKANGVRVVNFEDEGSGAEYADLVVNALYEQRSTSDPRHLYGYKYFCLRDEFASATQNSFREKPQEVLITFGGTDIDDFTRLTLETIYPVCEEQHIAISIVTGPGYAHREALESRVAELQTMPQCPSIDFTHVTNVMSKYMERADFAICSAGRTVYEFTHMRVPAIVMSHHKREDMHTFARPANGFLYLGVMAPFCPEKLQAALQAMLTPEERKKLFLRQSRFNFTANKTKVVKKLLALLE